MAPGAPRVVSCRAFHHVLVLLDDDEAAMSSLLERAIELVEAEHARLTIAKMTDPGRIVRWFGPVAMLSRCGPVLEPTAESQCHALDRACARVPASIPLTRVLLTPDTIPALRRLAEREEHDLLIVKDALLRHNRGLRAEVRRLGICTLTVCDRSGGCVSEPESVNPLIQEDVLEHQR
jgi:hypothetical protein